ncbi:Copper chaperone for superoxide dismutase [Abeliophyllum distichum]|uniref:Growth-regulating factor n=1 Tax=Abeliophyllum distichum TaxID=126358 RepID=A0ABD1TW49_9LAMI
MAFLRPVVTTKTTTIVAIPASSHFSSSSNFPQKLSKNLSFGSFHISSNSILKLGKSGLVKNLGNSSLASVQMDSPSSDQKPPAQTGAVLPELLAEFMVDMKCEGCVNSVKNKLRTVDGVKNVDVDFSNQVVRVLGTSPVKILAETLEQTGRKARLIGQGVPEDFLVSAAVSEFKGPNIFGVVRLAQINMELARIEATFSGLPPGKHSWSINEFGDLTKGAASTGKVFNPKNSDKEPLGDLGTLEVDEKGEAFYSGVKEKLRVADLIGRSIVVYETEDKSDQGLTAAVIARSAGVGENYKKLCTCDGTTIWEATNADFVPRKATSTRHGNGLLEDEHCKISGAFTLLQLEELQHQAIIFKYMEAGIPIPFHLIMPILKSVTSSISSCQALYPNLLGYGHLYTASLDPEHGRCRRTDGKKWRCRKGAVTGHKYCKRHMHRGRDGAAFKKAC